MRKVVVQELGRIDYLKAWDYQKELFAEVIDRKLENRKLKKSGESLLPSQNYLLFCEHPHVYTLGRSGLPENLLLDEKGLEENDATFYKINRGGDITYHGLGQVVGYPIFDLDEFFTDIAKYVRFLEEAVILVLNDYGIQGDRIAGLSGVWLDVDSDNPRKICAVGIHLSRWVTMHGFAFNVNTDLDYFGHIVPCGIQDKGVTSLAKELGYEVELREVIEKLIEKYKQLFDINELVDFAN